MTSDNGICDDDGPGGATGDGFTATCSLGHDCADCGPRRLPPGTVVVSPSPGVAASTATLVDLREAQLACLSEHKAIVTGGSNGVPVAVDKLGIDGIGVFCSPEWVPSRTEASYRHPDELCRRQSQNTPSAVRISLSGCGEYRASPCHVCCALTAPPMPPSAPPYSPGICLNTCEWAGTRGCNDGGPGSEFATCDYGTDCDDCGARAYSPPLMPPSLPPGGTSGIRLSLTTTQQRLVPSRPRHSSIACGAAQRECECH